MAQTAGVETVYVKRREQKEPHSGKENGLG